MPIDINYESKIQKKYGHKIIAGIDEVGRGPLAGPVTAGAFVFMPADKHAVNPVAELIKEHKELEALKDSKLLTARQRENIFDVFKQLKEEGRVDFATASVFPVTIDKKQIHHAVVLAMRRAARKLEAEPDHAVVDGFRYPRDILTQFNYTSVKKADGLVPSVAAASVIAKVKRDKSMEGYYHKKYPEYRFDLHKGYGTKLHYDKLQEFGPSPIHRKSFRLK